MRSRSALSLAAALLLALALTPAPAAAFPFSLTAALTPELPDQVPAPVWMIGCQTEDHIAYGYGATGTAACHDATNAANADCQSATSQNCCTITNCTCVNGAGGFACTEHFTYHKFIN
jgi:hypothetical protein